jgi:putative transposase
MGYCFSVTIVTSDRRPIFADTSVTERAMDCLLESVERFDADVYAYCFMPDHLHLLARTPEGIRFDEFIRHFKQLTGFRLPREPGIIRVWQPSYYDHALRRPEQLEATAKYILDNPVRAGLVTETNEYPFGGSLVWKLASDEPKGSGLRSMERSASG